MNTINQNCAALTAFIWLTATAALAQDIWKQANGPFSGGNVRAFALTANGEVFVGINDDGVYRSTNSDYIWSPSNTGLTSGDIRAFAVNHDKNYVFVGTLGGGIFRSKDNGDSWSPVSFGLTDLEIRSLTLDSASGHLFAGTRSKGIFRSIDDGESWISTNQGLDSSRAIHTIMIHPNRDIFVGTNGSGIFRSMDDGATWMPLSNSLSDKIIRCMSINPNEYIIVGTNIGVFRLVDDGENWRLISTSMPNDDIYSLAIDESSGYVFAGTQDNGVFYSTNEGEEWERVNTDLTMKSVQALMIESPGRIFAGSGGEGVFHSQDQGRTWIQTNIGLKSAAILSVVMNTRDNVVFVGTDNSGGIFRTSDNGNNWASVNTGLGNKTVRALAIDSNQHLFAGTEGGVFRSMNNAETWEFVGSDSMNIAVHALAISPSGGVFAGTRGRGIFLSTNNGDDWIPVNTGLTNSSVLSLAIDSTRRILAGTNGGGVFQSTDNATTWRATSTALANTVANAIAISPSDHIFVGTESNGIWRSIDHGNPWSQISAGLTNSVVRALAINASGYVYAGTAEGVFRSRDNGENWEAVNFNLTNIDVRCLTIRKSDGKVVVGTMSGLFWTVPFIEHTNLTLGQGGQQISIEADITGLEAATLWYRKGGDRDSVSQAMTKNGIRYQQIIPASFVTSRGVEYFIAAQDLSGSTRSRWPASEFFSISVQVGNINKPTPQPSGSGQTDYRLFSVPLQLDNKDARAVLEDDLGLYKNSRWRLFELLPDQSYAELPNVSAFSPGKAFWLIVLEAGKNITTGPGKSNPTSKPYSIALHPGWNFVANPFNFTIPVDNLRLQSNGTSPVLRFYEQGWNDPNDAKVDSIRPFEGYAVQNNFSSVDSLLVDPDLSSSTNSLPKRSASAGESEFLWSVQIRAQCQEAKDVDNVAAVAAGASASWDAIDLPEPPVIGDYLSISFPHRDWQSLAKSFCIDARPEPTEGILWEFEVKTNIHDKVHLTFTDIESVPSEFEVWLVDDAIAITQDLRETDSYTVAGSENPRSLKLVVGKSEFVENQIEELQLVPTEFELSQNFPNPFNPATTIRYGLPRAERVVLKIYNLLGSEVVTLVDNELQDAGYHVAVWDGRDKNGIIVTSGLYIYRLRAGSFTMTKKMALVK